MNLVWDRDGGHHPRGRRALGGGRSARRRVRTVERFCATGLKKTPSRGSYRATLRRLGRELTTKAPWEPRPEPMPARKVSPPYPAAEMKSLWLDIARQSTPSRRRATKALYLLGAGAGLDGRWAREVRGSDVRRVDGVVLVRVGAPRPRDVPVLREYEDELLALAADAGDEYLVGGNTTHRKRTNEIVARFEDGHAHLKLDPKKLRSTWIVTHLTMGTRLPELLEAAGTSRIETFDTLLAYVPALEAPGPEDVSGFGVSGRSAPKMRAPIDVTGGRPPTTTEFITARRLVADSGVLAPLQDCVDAPTGRPRSLSVEAFLVAAQLNALRRDHTAKIVDIARTLNSSSSNQLKVLGVRNWDPRHAYKRTDHLFNKLIKALDDDGQTDRTWFSTRVVEASLMDLPATSSSGALDATDIEAWGRLHWPRSGSGGESKPPRVLCVDANGRDVRTADPDARDGHRSATNSRRAGIFTRYDLHNFVQVRDVRSSDGRENVVFGPDVPPVVTRFALAPAGTPLDETVVPHLEDMNRDERRLRDLLVDRGYSQLSATGLFHPVRRAGMELTFQPKGDHQRLQAPFSEFAVVIDGQLFSALMPKHLWQELPWPPYGAGEAEVSAYEQAYNERSRWRFQLHAGPSTEGTTRWKCPFHAGFLRSRQLPFTMSRPRTTPLVELPEGAKCCEGIISVSAADLPFRQRFTPGSTAWRKSYRRRNVVEGVNAFLKGGFVNIGQKFFRVLRLTKLTFLLAFTIAGYIVECIRSFNERKAVEADAVEARKHRRKGRRQGTWSHLLDGAGADTGPDPPPG